MVIFFHQGSQAMGVLNQQGKVGDQVLGVGVSSACTGEAARSTNTSGCFKASDGDGDEVVRVAGEDVGEAAEVRQRWRTLAGFSTEAQTKMAGQVRDFT